MSVSTMIVIPARLASTRLPEKLLRVVAGKSILHHTLDAARRCKVTSEVIVAVDDQRLADEVESIDGKWIMTDPNCASGTDRLAEVAKAFPNVDVLVNVQGDEPEIDPHAIDTVAKTLIENPDADMSTVGTPIRSREKLDDPNCVKIVMAEGVDEAGQGRAVYFSRAALPFIRDGIDQSLLTAEPPTFWHHLGLYAYRRDFLMWFASQPPSTLEKLERLEQLRAIESGKTIVVSRVEQAASGIDTLEDLQDFEKRWRRAA